MSGRVVRPRVYGRVYNADAEAATVDGLTADAVRLARLAFGPDVTLEIQATSKIFDGDRLAYGQFIDMAEVLDEGLPL
jgi:hypothetical protein